MKLVLLKSGAIVHTITLSAGVNLIVRGVDAGVSTSQIDLTPYDPDATVSRRHAQLVVDAGGGASIEDLKSTNGTFVQPGVQLEPGVAFSLQYGDEIIVGKVLLRLES